MACQVDIAELQRKAIEYLQNRPERTAGRSSQEAATSIANLAFEEGNPVRELFLHAPHHGTRHFPVSS